jgi:hypothetical protein
MVDEGPEVFRPEYNGVYPVSRRRNNRYMLIKGIDDLKDAFSDLLHKPGHVEGRNIGSSGSGDNDLGIEIHGVHTSANRDGVMFLIKGMNPKEIIYHRGTEYTEINSPFLTASYGSGKKLCPWGSGYTICFSRRLDVFDLLLSPGKS